MTNEIVVENKPYYKDTSEEEISALKQRVFVYADHIICLRELIQITPFSVNLLFDEVDKHIDQLKRSLGLLVDLRVASKPDVSYRREINKRFALLNKKKPCQLCGGW